MYKAIKTDAWTLIPEIIDVDFEIRQPGYVEGSWIYVVKGAVTGYESANVKQLVEEYPRRGVFSAWVACGGTLRKYDHLEVPMSEIIKFLEDQGLIEVKREYGYVREIIWKDELGGESE